MADKFQNKYRIPSARLQNWDYGTNAAYFVTICTANREHFFGNILVKQDSNKKELMAEMILSETGIIAEKYWYEIPQHFPFVKLDAFITMPNHIHGIIIIDKKKDEKLINARDAINRTDAINRVCTPEELLKKEKGGITGDKNPMLHDNLSRILRWYKGRVSFEAHKINPQFAWQSRFHDHIIRNEKSFARIQQYIINNPAKWGKDKFNGKDN